jgi:hypothetical protein
LILDELLKKQDFISIKLTDDTQTRTSSRFQLLFDKDKVSKRSGLDSAANSRKMTENSNLWTSEEATTQEVGHSIFNIEIKIPNNFRSDL